MVLVTLVRMPASCEEDLHSHHDSDMARWKPLASASSVGSAKIELNAEQRQRSEKLVLAFNGDLGKKQCRESDPNSAGAGEPPRSRTRPRVSSLGVDVCTVVATIALGLESILGKRAILA